MKRFLKVILIMVVVFGVLGLGLTAGGAAMGATMGDVGILDNGLIMIGVPYYSLNAVKGGVLALALIVAYVSSKDD